MKDRILELVEMLYDGNKRIEKVIKEIKEMQCSNCKHYQEYIDDNNYYYCALWDLTGTGSDEKDYCYDFYCKSWEEKQ